MSSISQLSLDDYFTLNHAGSIDRAIGDNIYGFNHRLAPSAVPSSRDHQGFVFFVRPQLNMTDANVRSNRHFYPLLADKPLSIQRITRTTLDPRLNASGGRFPSPLVDNYNCFIPAFTNNLKSLSGWPDQALPTYTSKKGLYGEEISHPDGSNMFNGTFTLDATFRNTRGDVILSINSYWQKYMSAVFENSMSPYADFIVEREYDFNTRIFRITLDQSKRFVQKIASSGPAFPISDPTGSFFDFDSERPYSEQNAEFTIRFQCMGFEANDDILISEFNDTVSIFNAAMEDQSRESTYVKVPHRMLKFFNNRGYPRIDLDSYELEWWVDSSLFEQRLSAIKEAMGISPETLQDNDIPYGTGGYV